MSFIIGKDTIRGTDATITCELNGVVHDFMHVKNFESNAEIETVEIPRIGTRVKGVKATSLGFSGSFTAYYMNPVLREAFMAYKRTGIYPDITITTRVDDKDSRVGPIEIAHRRCYITNFSLAKFDAESNALEEDYEFTCEDVEVITEFEELPEAKLSE